MRVAMVMMRVSACFSYKFFNGHHAAMQFRAVFVFELNRSVRDVEVIAKNVLELKQNFVAL